MAFRKYPSLLIWDHLKERAAALEATGDGEVYLIQEKIDGANFQMLFQPHTQLCIGRRNGWIKEGETFFGYQQALKTYSDELQRLQEYCDASGCSLRVYGEIYGNTVQKRIPYSERLKIAIFDASVDDTFLAPVALDRLLGTLKLRHMAVPVVSFEIASDLHQWLQDNQEKDSLLAPGYTAEGYVVRPYMANYKLDHGYVILKHKNRSFLEVQRPVLQDTNLTPLQEEFKGYINANRAVTLVSKLGPPKDKAEIGKKYIRALKEDALADFKRAHPGLGAAELAALTKVKLDSPFSLFLEFVQ